MIKEEFNLDLPFPDVFPPEWDKEIGPRDFVMFRNLDHFKHVVSKITQKSDDNCGVSYKKALEMLLNDESDFPEEEQMSIRNLVRKNLFKRGLITEEIYENFRYDVEGTQVGVDVGKYAAGEADCVMVPGRRYVDFFHELYVSISYPYTVSNADVRRNTAKLLATIEELERQHIFIKVTLIFPGHQCGKVPGADISRNFCSTIPLFSHKDQKSVGIMSAVLNDRLLRKFYFAILEDLYQNQISWGYGTPMTLERAMNIGYEFNEVEFFQKIKNIYDPDTFMME